MAKDPRAVANYILKKARDSRVPITNMALNKLVYFLHAEYLYRFNKPLITAKIEAWEHGPVIREVYNSFRKFGSSEINSFAEKFDPIKNEKIIVELILDIEEQTLIDEIFPIYVLKSASQLRNLSHESGGPWDRVYNDGEGKNPGMEISNERIHKHHKSRTRH